MQGLTSGLKLSGVEQLDRIEMRNVVCENVVSDNFHCEIEVGGLAVVIAVLALFEDFLG